MSCRQQDDNVLDVDNYVLTVFSDCGIDWFTCRQLSKHDTFEHAYCILSMRSERYFPSSHWPDEDIDN